MFYERYEYGSVRKTCGRILINIAEKFVGELIDFRTIKERTVIPKVFYSIKRFKIFEDFRALIVERFETSFLRGNRA